MPAAIDPRLVELFLEAARIDAVSGRERPMADYLRRVCAALGMSVEEDDAGTNDGGNAGNVVSRAGSGGEIALLAHMDTARPTAGVRPIVHADRITSDGTTVLGVDDRVGIAVLLRAAERVLRGGGGRRDFTLAFTICEETTLAGSRQLRLPPSVRMAVLFDSSRRPGHFIARSYGAKRWTAEVAGRAAHAGLAPEKGISAIVATARAVARLPLGRLDEEATANVGMIGGGSALNVVPERALVEGEIRAIRPSRVEEIEAAFQRTFEEETAALGASLAWTSGWDFEPYNLDPESAVRRRVEDAIRAAGLTPTACVSAGGSDANSLNARGIPAINVGTGAQNPHGDDEFILLEDLAKSTEIALALLS